MATNTNQDLVALGFTEIEARAYCELLRNGPATGYRLASAIDRAPSNIYQILESLRRKRAILTDEADPRTFRAVDVRELLDSLERGFKRHKEGALDSLRSVRRDAPDDRFYNLRTVEEVYDRARTMVANAKEVILFDLFPGPFETLMPLLEEKAGRKVKVGGISYGELPKTRHLQIWNHPWQLVEKTWPGQQITVVADARECLIALLTNDGEDLRHAMWTDSVYLSCLQHGALACEIQVAAKKREPNDPIVKLGLLTTPPIGLRTLAREAAEMDQSSRRKA